MTELEQYNLIIQYSDSEVTKYKIKREDPKQLLEKILNSKAMLLTVGDKDNSPYHEVIFISNLERVKIEATNVLSGSYPYANIELK